MKKNNKWFTLIELLISSIIIILLSTFSISIFFDRQSAQFLREEINKVKQDIIFSKKELWNKITDFEFEFHIWNDFYIKNINKLYKDNLLYISWWINTYSNFSSWFTINLTSSKQNTPFLLKILKENKIILKDFLSSTWSLDFFIKDNSDYLFKAFFNTNLSNTLQIIPFSNFDKKNYIKLINIIDDTNNSYSWIILRQNLLNDMQFQTLTWNVIKTDKIILEFNANNEIFVLEITK